MTTINWQERLLCTTTIFITELARNWSTETDFKLPKQKSQISHDSSSTSISGCFIGLTTTFCLQKNTMPFRSSINTKMNLDYAVVDYLFKYTLVNAHHANLEHFSTQTKNIIFSYFCCSYAFQLVLLAQHAPRYRLV